MSTDFEQPFALSIDKISLTCNDTDPSQVEKACHRLLEAANRPFSGLRIASSRWHKLQCSMTIPGSTNSFLIQAGPRFPKIADYRFEFNPSEIGKEGLAYARAFVDSVTRIGTNALFANGNVTRLDLALDFPGMSLENVVVRSLSQRKHAVFTDSRGELETIYLGSPRANRTTVYQKIKLQTEFLRVERRMKPKIRGHELVRFPNPFDKVQMIPINSLLPYLDGMIPRQFFDSVRMRGIGHVISELPPYQRRGIKRALADPKKSLLPPLPFVWSCWPDAFAQSGLEALCQRIAVSEAAE